MGSEMGSEMGSVCIWVGERIDNRLRRDGMRGRSAAVRTEGDGMGSEWEGGGQKGWDRDARQQRTAEKSKKKNGGDSKGINTGRGVIRTVETKVAR